MAQFNGPVIGVKGERFKFHNTLNPIKPIVYYFPTAAANFIKTNEFLAANALFSLIPIGGVNDNFERRFGSATYDTADYTGVLGLPVYGSIEFGNTDPNVKNNNQYTAIDGKVYHFDNLTVDCCLVTCQQDTNIIETKITGRAGRIKESIGLDDWNLSITLIFDNAPLQAPTDFIAHLWQIKQAAVAVPVTNYFLNLLDIHFIVIKNISMPQETGKYSSQTVVITAVSDIPLADFLP